MGEPQQHTTVVVQQQPGISGLAIAGLIFSIIGWFTCGLLCLIGAPLSFLGLFSKGPKGVAWAGLIVGFPGVAFFAFLGLGLIMGIVNGLGAAADTAMDDMQKELERAEAQAKASAASSNDQESGIVLSPDDAPVEPVTVEPQESESPDPITPAEPNEPPTDPAPAEPDTPETPSPTVPDEPAEPKVEPKPNGPIVRTWTSGQFKVEAKFVRIGAGDVTLERSDGSTVTVPLSSLSEDDQNWVRDYPDHKGTRP